MIITIKTIIVNIITINIIIIIVIKIFGTLSIFMCTRNMFIFYATLYGVSNRKKSLLGN